VDDSIRGGNVTRNLNLRGTGARQSQSSFESAGPISGQLSAKEQKLQASPQVNNELVILMNQLENKGAMARTIDQDLPQFLDQ